MLRWATWSKNKGSFRFCKEFVTTPISLHPGYSFRVRIKIKIRIRVRDEIRVRDYMVRD